MASELNYDKLVKLVKGDKDITQGQAAEKLGLSIGQVSMLKFCQAQVEAGKYAKAPATGPSVKKLRDSEGNRWELIAARTGLGVAAVKAKYEEAGGDAAKSYTGRGRDFQKTTGKPSSRKPASRTSKPAGRAKPGAKPAGRAKPGAKQGSKPVIRRTTRRSTAGNPS